MKRTNLKVIPSRDELEYTSRFSEEKLNAFRRMGDPLADEVCHSLHYNHGGLTNKHDSLETVRTHANVLKNTEVSSSDLQRNEKWNEFDELLADCHEVPSWVDWDLIYTFHELIFVCQEFIRWSTVNSSCSCHCFGRKHHDRSNKKNQ